MYKANIFKSIDGQDKPLALAVRIYEDASMTTMAEIKTPSGDTTTTIQWNNVDERNQFYYNGYTLFYDERVVKVKKMFYDDVKNIKSKSEPTLADKTKSETDIYCKEESDRKYRRVMDDIKRRSKDGYYDLVYCVMNEANLYEYVAQNKNLFYNNGFHVKHIKNCWGAIDMSTVMISWR